MIDPTYEHKAIIEVYNPETHLFDYSKETSVAFIVNPKYLTDSNVTIENGGQYEYAKYDVNPNPVITVKYEENRVATLVKGQDFDVYPVSSLEFNVGTKDYKAFGMNNYFLTIPFNIEIIPRDISKDTVKSTEITPQT